MAGDLGGSQGAAVRDADPGVPMGHYIDHHHGAGIDVACLRCMAGRRVEFEHVLKALAKQGINGRHVGIVEVARYFTSPCPCGGSRFVTRPAFPISAGMGSADTSAI